MRLPEQRLWDRMRRGLSPYRIVMHRIENVVGEGMPDVVAACNGQVSFIELKQIETLPKRNTTPLLGKKQGLSAEQKNWHLDWTEAGGISFVIVGYHDKIVMLGGCFAEDINGMDLMETLQHSLAFNWVQVAQRLGASETWR